MTATTLNEQLIRAATSKGGLRLLDRCEEVRWLSWEEVHTRARAVAFRLRRLGLAPGERVALIFPTGEEFFDAFFGTLLAGGVPAPLYPPVRLGRLEEYHQRTAKMIALAQAPLVLAQGRVRRLLGEAMRGASLRFGCLRLQDLPSSSEEEEGLPTPTLEDLALVQFSSGTTVDPKPVALSHRAIFGQTNALNSFWPDSDELRHTGVSWLPLYHDMGLIGCVFAALEKQTELTLIPPEVFVTRPAVWLRAISTYGATVSPAPNFAYGLCLRKVKDEELEGVDLSSWRVALNGAEPVSAPVLRAFQERFGPYGLRPEALTPVYGLAEAALAVTFSDLGSTFRSTRFHRQTLATEGWGVEHDDGVELVSVGRPLPGFDLSLRNAEGEEVEDGKVGRVWVRGPSLMEGYLDQPEATAAALQGGWLDTGDEGLLHGGELYLTGRAKDMLILRGRNLAPQIVEQALDAVPGVRVGCAVAVSFLPEGGETEELVLLVEVQRGTPEEVLTALPEGCRKAVLRAAGVAPDRVEPLDPGTLPRTSSGKLRRQEALRLYRAGELAPPDKVTPLRLAAAMGRSAWAFAREKRAAK